MDKELDNNSGLEMKNFLLTENNEELIKIQKELIEFGPYTLGIFRDEQQTEYKNYRRVAALLAGHVPRFSTFRISCLDENFEEIVHMGVFNTQSLLKHITQESMPKILNIGYGFTTDLAIRPEPTFLLIYDSTQKMSQELRVLFSMLPNKLGDKLNSIKLIELDKVHSLPIEGFLNEINLSNLNEFNEAAINCVKVPDIKWFENEFTKNIIELFSHEFLKSSNIDNSWQPSFNVENKTHPLMQLQLEQINLIFGRQQIKMKPESFGENSIKNSFEHFHNVRFEGVDTEKSSYFRMSNDGTFK
ncbi:hypothetical protein Mgra_00002537 [Meloidogyne graminicola]|uniref:Uncharacterized protein n=1 Tax=Meloidogyne graminicola TaxID=189291 RepID=A0A8S9ZY40_9BILA|nr:hypothetical protein Mgra_00002537 [Meloidogyne graminicola]